MTMTEERRPDKKEKIENQLREKKGDGYLTWMKKGSCTSKSGEKGGRGFSHEDQRRRALAVPRLTKRPSTGGREVPPGEREATVLAEQGKGGHIRSVRISSGFSKSY